MSDAPATSGLTTDAVPDAVTAPPSSSNGAAPPAAPPDPLAEPPADRAVFDRGYVESVRREAQRYRDELRQTTERAQVYDNVFGVYDQGDRDTWLQLARTWSEDPNKAAQIMQQIAGNVLGEQTAVGAGTAGAPSPDDQLPTDEPESLTPEKVAKLIDERFSAREAKVAEAAAIEEVYSEVRQAGFDPNSAEGFMVLWNANHFTNGDIGKAVQLTQGYKQQIIDDYVAGRSSGHVAMPTASGGAPANMTAEPIRNLEDARRATDAFLRERRGAS